MKYITTSGQPITSPIDLGENGRGDDGRAKVSIRISPAAAGNGDYGYVMVGGSVVLTAPREGQRGVLMPVLTHTGYQRGCSGWSRVICGAAEPIAEGAWADGNAGRTGHGTDTLWHITGAALMEVHYSGSRGGSAHNTWIAADARGYVWCGRLADLVAQVVLDAEPRLRDIVKALQADLPAELGKALKMVEDIEDEVCVSAPVAHFGDLDCLELVDLSVRDRSRGVGTLQGNVFPPGDRQLAVFFVGPGGGKRYDYEVIEMRGLEVIRDHTPSRSASKLIVAYITSPDWGCRWVESKDGAPTGEKQVP